jgi:hypothetical protein
MSMSHSYLFVYEQWGSFKYIVHIHTLIAILAINSHCRAQAR